MQRSQTEEIKEKLPIEDVVGQYVKLTKAGKDFKGLCPFHGEKTPSFFVSPDKNVWHCFGCGKGGDVFTFVQEIEGLEFYDALRLLADKAGVELRPESREESGRRKEVLDVLQRATDFYETTLNDQKSESRVWQYLKERGVGRDLAEEFHLGFAPEGWSSLVENFAAKKIDGDLLEAAGLALVSNKAESVSPESSRRERSRHYDRFRGRIMFPIQNVQGATVGFSGRIAPWVARDEESRGRTPAKYINTPNTAVYDKSRALYGLHQARHAIRKSDVAVLVEGQLDVLLCHKIGFRQTVAASGTAFTGDHARALHRYSQNVIMLFDMDEAGEKAARRAFAVAVSAGMDVKIAALPNGRDPADLAQEDPAALEKVLGAATDALSFFLNRSLEHHDVNTARGKRSVMNTMLPLLASLESAVEVSHWAAEMGHRLGVSENAIGQEIKRFGETSLASKVRSSQGEAENDAGVVRSRRLLLEEHLCGLVLQYPVLVEHLQDDALGVFTAKELRVIMEVVLRERPKRFDDVRSSFSSDVQIRAARLAFQIEKRIPDSDAAKREFSFLYSDLRRAHLRELLQALGTSMRQAEMEGNGERLAELQSEFTDISQQLTKLQ